MTQQEKELLLQEIPKYLKEHCYRPDGTIKHNDLWLVGWIAAEFYSRKNAMKVLINNEYGLLGNLLYKLSKSPDTTITKFMEFADLEVLCKAIEEAGHTVLHRNELTQDPYAMRLLIRHDEKFLQYVDRSLLKSKKFLPTVVSVCPAILADVLPSMFDDEEFALSLVKENAACMKYLPHKFRSNYRFCMEAARQDGFSLMYFDLTFMEKDEIMLAAVSNRGNALSLANGRQRKDREIVYAAVKNCGLALGYADDIWKGDFDLVLLAVSGYGMALQYASPELRDCEALVKVAVQNDGYSIRFASERLRGDMDMMMLAMASYPHAYNYFPMEQQKNPQISKLYAHKIEEEKKWLQSKLP